MKEILAGGDRFLAGAQKELSEWLQINIYQDYASTEIGYISCPDVNQKPVYGSAGKLVIPIRVRLTETYAELYQDALMESTRFKFDNGNCTLRSLRILACSSQFKDIPALPTNQVHQRIRKSKT